MIISIRRTIAEPENIDLGEYPESHSYMFFTNSENVPQSVHSALDTMSECQGMRVSDMLSRVSKSLDRATAGSRHSPIDLENGDPMMIDSDNGMSVVPS